MPLINIEENQEFKGVICQVVILKELLGSF